MALFSSTIVPDSEPNKNAAKRRTFFLFVATIFLAGLTVKFTFLAVEIYNSLISGYGNDCILSLSGENICSLPGNRDSALKNSGGSSSQSSPLQSPQLSEAEIHSRSISWSLLNPSYQSTQNRRIAFLFLVKGPIPFELMWERFLKGYEDKYSIYIKPSSKYVYENGKVLSDIFFHRSLPELSSTEAEDVFDSYRRLLYWALLEPTNQMFVLVSDSCVPVRPFPYVYHYLMESKQSFVDNYPVDASKSMLSRGSPWFSLHRRHALSIVADVHHKEVYYKNCESSETTSNQESGCQGNEWYLPTYFQEIDPTGITNYTVTFSEYLSSGLEKHHLKKDISLNKIRQIQIMKTISHPQQKDGKFKGLNCVRNGQPRPCFLFINNVHTSAAEVFRNLPDRVLGY